MSRFDYRSQRLDRQRARKLLTVIIRRHPGNVIFLRHALEQLSQRDLTTQDVMNVLGSPTSKILKDGELEKGSYRYRVETNLVVIVISFVEATKLVVVTGWRIK